MEHDNEEGWAWACLQCGYSQLLKERPIMKAAPIIPEAVKEQASPEIKTEGPDTPDKKRTYIKKHKYTKGPKWYERQERQQAAAAEKVAREKEAETTTGTDTTVIFYTGGIVLTPEEQRAAYGTEGDYGTMDRVCQEQLKKAAIHLDMHCNLSNGPRRNCGHCWQTFKEEAGL